MQILSQFKR
jgi:Cdc6-like AAA superfamily ATPase